MTEGGECRGVRTRAARARSETGPSRLTDSFLQQTQLAGAGDGFGAALHLEFVEDAAVVPFDGVQGQEKPFADLPFRESPGDQHQDFQLATAQRLE